MITYSISTLLLVPAIASILSLRSSGKVEGRKRRVNLRSIVEGVEFIWIQRIILSLFVLDFGVTLVGFYRPILPIFAADVFNMGASGLGLLYAAPSAGSLVGSTALLMAGDIKHKGIAVVMAAVGFAVSLALLGGFQVVLAGGAGELSSSALPIQSALPSAARWFSFWPRTRCLGGPTV